MDSPRSKSVLISPPNSANATRSRAVAEALAPWARRGQPLAKLGSFISTVRPRSVHTHASRGQRRTGLAPGASAKLSTRGLSDGGGCGGDGGEGSGHGSGGDASCRGGGCGGGRSGCTTRDAAARATTQRRTASHCRDGAAGTAQPCRLRLVPPPDTPAGCSLLSSCARVCHRALGVRCLSESLVAAVRRLSKTEL